jgi:hypothetical protein
VLRTKIQDDVDYKEYNIVNHFFQLAKLAKTELQGWQPMKMKTFTHRLAYTAPSRTATPLGSRSLMTPSALRPPSTSSTPSAIALYSTDPSKASILQGAATVKTSSCTVSTGHRCHGIGHFQQDCPSRKSYIATADGGYVSDNDTKDDLALQTNHSGDLADVNDDAHVLESEHMTEYNTKTYVVQRVLSAHVDHSEKLQRNNLFQILFVIKDCHVRTIIDCGSCNNFVSVDFVKKISLRLDGWVLGPGVSGLILAGVVCSSFSCPWLS